MMMIDDDEKKSANRPGRVPGPLGSGPGSPRVSVDGRVRACAFGVRRSMRVRFRFDSIETTHRRGFDDDC